MCILQIKVNDFIKCTARISRTGIYRYLASELPGVPEGTPPNAIVYVHRSADEVFHPESLASFENLPVTIGHPPGGVTPKTAKGLIQGVVASPVTQDADGVKAPIVLMTDEAQTAYKQGRRQLSAGYEMNLRWKSGFAADGTPYDAEQSNIRGNHLAMVARGRAGNAQILDEENSMTFDELKKQLEDARNEIAALTADRDKLAGQVTALQSAQLTDEAIDAKVADGVKARLAEMKAREEVIVKAKKFAPAMQVSDNMTVKDIQSVAIRARIADAVLDGKSDEYVAGIFDSLSAQPQKESISRSPVLPPSGLAPDQRRHLCGLGG